MSPERYVDDAHALVNYLRERFGQDKVYVLGESWGSPHGIMLVQPYPELFHTHRTSRSSGSSTPATLPGCPSLTASSRR